MNSSAIDLTLPLEGLDLDSLLLEWRWLVPQSYQPIQMNKFGWWFFTDESNQVFLLDLIEGQLQHISNSIHEFNSKKDTPEAHSDWYQDGFIFRCYSEGLHLQPSQCYIWKIAPILGGKFEFENISVMSLLVCQSISGQLFRQLHERGPDATITGFKIQG